MIVIELNEEQAAQIRIALRDALQVTTVYKIGASWWALKDLRDKIVQLEHEEKNDI